MTAMMMSSQYSRCPMPLDLAVAMLFPCAAAPTDEVASPGPIMT